LKKNHTDNCLSVDQPITALLKDLKRRGLLDETIVLLASEFGRTPGTQGPTAATTMCSASAWSWPAAA
jgi:membrane-anchored protein YejM (alkaline phosphatase superfamily)